MKKKFKNSQIFALIPILLFAFVSIANTYSQNGLNKFSDPIIREIHELADHRDSIALLKFLKDSNPNYQGEALMCFGSIQAASLNDSIAQLMNSEMNGIRMAAAFALGQSFHQSAVSHIKDALANDTVELVRGMLYDALGKTGSLNDLQWMSEQKVDFQETEGLAQGILRFGMRRIISPVGNTAALKIIKTGSSTVRALQFISSSATLRTFRYSASPAFRAMASAAATAIFGLVEINCLKINLDTPSQNKPLTPLIAFTFSR